MLTAGSLTGKDMGVVLVKALPRMRAIVAKRSRPFVANVTKGGDVKVVLGGERKGGVKRTR